MGRLRSHNNRHRAIFNPNRNLEGSRCPFCGGRLRLREETMKVTIGTRDDQEFPYCEAIGPVPVYGCTKCDGGVIDWRGERAKEKLIEQQTPYGKSPDGLSWRYEEERVGA